MNPKVSVIVPIYNVEKYLKKCVDSIMSQTFEDIEIILIDDGSTDNSGKIADEYSKIDDRIIVIHKENGGQGSARNAGLDIARGQYVGFVDSDDWIDLNMYENLYINIMENNADISICGRRVFNEDNCKICEVFVNNAKIEVNSENLVQYIVNELLYKHTVVVYNKLYTKRIINENNIKFKEVKDVGSEDALFNYQVLLHCKKIISITNVYHNQLAREGSTAREYKVGAMKRTGKLIEEMYKYSNKTNNLRVFNDASTVLLVFFQQWNYNLIKTYGKEKLVEYLEAEHKEAERNMFFKKAEINFIFSKVSRPYIYDLGYSKKGKLFMNLYMLSSFLGFYKLSAKIRCSI